MADAVACKTMSATSNGVWQGDVPVHFALPLLIVQIVLVLAITRALAFVLKPLKQPRVVAEIIVSFRAPIMHCTFILRVTFFTGFHGASKWR